MKYKIKPDTIAYVKYAGLSGNTINSKVIIVKEDESTCNIKKLSPGPHVHFKFGKDLKLGYWAQTKNVSVL